MSNTTIATTQGTKAPQTSTTEFIPTTNQNYTTETTAYITSTVEETTTEFLTSTTNHSNGSTGNTHNDNSGQYDGAIAGGCVGGVVILIVVVVIVLLIRRRKLKKKKMKKVPEPPGKDLLDTIHEENAIRYHRENNQEQDIQVVKQYVNLTPDGYSDEQTDPSVGPDGYLKKTKNFFGKNKHKKHKKHHVKGQTKVMEEGRDELPIYTNEPRDNGKQAVGRTNLVPADEAPPPPRKTSEYATGRIPANSDYQNNGQMVDSTLNEQYVNMGGQQKDKAVCSSERKHKQNVSGKESGVVDQQQKLYENINGANYYNLKDKQQEPLQRQSTYEDVGENPNNTFQQDDVYENP